MQRRADRLMPRANNARGPLSSRVIPALEPQRVARVAQEHPILQLQKAIGNRAVERTLAAAVGALPPTVQRIADLGSLDVSVLNGKSFAGIKGAHVHIDQAGISGPKSIDLVTDREGNAPSIELEEGNYTITVTAVCCDAQTFNMYVSANQSNFLTVQMKNCDCRIASQDDSEAPTGSAPDATDDGTA